jgi:hypothetical protein
MTKSLRRLVLEDEAKEELVKGASSRQVNITGVEEDAPDGYLEGQGKGKCNAARKGDRKKSAKKPDDWRAVYNKAKETAATAHKVKAVVAEVMALAPTAGMSVSLAGLVQTGKTATLMKKNPPDIVTIEKTMKGKVAYKATNLADALTKGASLLDSKQLRLEKASLEMAVHWLRKALQDKEEYLQAMRRTTHVAYHRMDQGHVPEDCVQCTDLQIPWEDRPAATAYLQEVKNTPNAMKLQCYLAEGEQNFMNIVKVARQHSDKVCSQQAEMLVLRQNLAKTLELNGKIQDEVKTLRSTWAADRVLLTRSRTATVNTHQLAEIYKERLRKCANQSTDPMVSSFREHAMTTEKADFYQWHNTILLNKIKEMDLHERNMATTINHLRSVAYEAANKTKRSFARTEKAESKAEQLKLQLKQAKGEITQLTMFPNFLQEVCGAEEVTPMAATGTAMDATSHLGSSQVTALAREAQVTEEIPAMAPMDMHTDQALADAEEVMQREAARPTLLDIPDDLLDSLDFNDAYTATTRGKANALRKAKSNRGSFKDVGTMENEDLKTLITTFFQDELTGLSGRDTKYTIEEQAAVDQMNIKTTYDAEAKQWTTGLLFSENPRLALDNNRGRAKAVLRSIYKKLHKRSESDQTLTKSTYDEMFDKFCRKVEENEIHLPSYTLESHAVYVPSSTTHPVRVVINAKSTCKTTGKSLNEILLQGPDYLPSLIGILLRFRTGKVAVVADISKMFLRIKMARQDQRWLQVFRMMDDGDMELFCFISLAFGLKSAPFQAQWVIREHAKMFQSRFPAAAEAVERDLYMDDLGKTGSRE